jgi:cytochrome P450
MLAMHKNAQQKVIHEIDLIYSGTDGTADFESIHKLDYMDMVIRETMRLFPVLPITARETTDEIELETYTIPKGTVLGIYAYGVQRSKKYWGEDANLFRPSRFEPENISKVHNYAFIPFTGGPRLCIGWRYAMFFMKVYLSHFFRHYTVDTTQKFEDIKLTFAPSVVFENKHMVSIKRRT